MACTPEELRLKRSAIQRARILKVQYDQEMSDPVWVSHARFEDIFPSSKPDPSIPTPYATNAFNKQNNTSSSEHTNHSKYERSNNSNTTTRNMTRKEIAEQKRRERASDRQSAMESKFSKPRYLEEDTEISSSPQKNTPSSDVSGSPDTSPDRMSRSQTAEVKRRERAAHKKQATFSPTSSRYDNSLYDDQRSSLSIQNIHGGNKEEDTQQQDFFVPEPFVFDATNDSLAQRLLELRNKRLEKERKMYEDPLYKKHWVEKKEEQEVVEKEEQD